MSEPFYDSQPQNSTTAIISLAAGILGLTFLPGIASIVAIIAGYLADKEIRESNGRLGGENFARIGKILGWIGVGIGVLGICCALMFLLILPITEATTSSSFNILPVFLSLVA